MTDVEIQEPEREVTRTSRSRRVWISLAVIFVVAAVLAVVFMGRFGQDPRLVDSPLIGKPLPELTLDYLDQDGSLTFSDLQGEVLVVNFWASWCYPCRLEHPALNWASDAYADRRVHFVGVLYQDERGPAMEFLDDLGWGTNYSYVVDDDSRATVEMGVFGVPETYFVDADGIIRGKVQGEVNQSVLVSTLDAILAGRTPDL